MNEIAKRFFWISLYAILMALLEAVVVVYIRHGLLWTNPANFARVSYIGMESWREAATIMMLITVGWLAGRQKIDRWAYGLYAFGLWDIWYYIWLKVLIDWPATLLNLEVFNWPLFLVAFALMVVPSLLATWPRTRV